jgi:hypothetical protein
MLKDEGGTRNLPRRHERCEGKGEDVGRGTTCGPRSLVSGPRSLVSGRWSLVPSPRLPISGLRSPVSIVAALLVVAGWALAQPAQPEAPVFKYYVWGQVRAPGAYSLGASPDLLELLSVAGGPTDYADVRHVVLVRATTQQRVNINLKTMLLSGQIVALYPGDIVIVPNSAWYSVQESFSVTTTLVSLATLIVTIWAWRTRP